MAVPVSSICWECTRNFLECSWIRDGKPIKGSVRLEREIHNRYPIGSDGKPRIETLTVFCMIRCPLYQGEPLPKKYLSIEGIVEE